MSEQPGAELGRLTGRLRCAAEDVEEERLNGRPGGGGADRRVSGRKESFSLGKKKKRNGEMDFCFMRSHYESLAMRLMCV